MSCFAYDELGRDGVEQLERLLRDEERRGAWVPRDGLPPADPPLPVAGLAALLLRYGRALRTLDAAHAGTVEPQKRRDVEAALHACMGRLLEVRAELSRRSAGALLAAATEAAGGGGGGASASAASSSSSSSLPPALIESLPLEEARQALRLGEEDAADVPTVPLALLRSGEGGGDNGGGDNTTTTTTNNLSRAAVLAARARFLDALLDKYNMAAAAAAAAAAMASPNLGGGGGGNSSPSADAAAQAAVAAAAATAEVASLGLLQESATATSLVSKALPAAVAPVMTLDQALDLLARCELGRQGRARAAVVAATAARAAGRSAGSVGGGEDNEEEERAAVCLQAAARGWAARRQRREDEAAERALLGVAPATLVEAEIGGGDDDDDDDAASSDDEDDANPTTTTATASTGTSALRRRYAPSAFLERPLCWSGRAARIARARDARRAANAAALTAALPGLLDETRRGDEAAGCRLQVRRRLDDWVAGLEERQRAREEEAAAAKATAAEKGAAEPATKAQKGQPAAPPRGKGKGGAAAAAEAAEAAAAASAAAAAAAAEWPPRLPPKSEGGSLRLLHPIPPELRELLDEEEELAAKRAAEASPSGEAPGKAAGKKGASATAAPGPKGAKKGAAAASGASTTAADANTPTAATITTTSAFLPRVAAAVACYAEQAERRRRRALCSNAEAEQRAVGYDEDRAREGLRALVAEEARREVDAEVRAELAEAERARAAAVAAAAAAAAATAAASGGGDGGGKKKKAKKGKEGEGGKKGDKEKKAKGKDAAKAKKKKKGKGDDAADAGLALGGGTTEAAAAAATVVAALDRSIESLFSELASNGVVVRLAPPSLAAPTTIAAKAGPDNHDDGSARRPLLRTFVGGDDCALPRPSAREVEAAVATLAVAVTPAAVAEVSAPGAGSGSGKKAGGSHKTPTGDKSRNNARAGPPAAQPPAPEVLEAAKRRAQEAERAARLVLRRALALSPAQVRSAVAAHCVLPLAAPAEVRAALAAAVAPRTVLIYGPPGSGKTLLAQAAAREAGALMLDLSPRQLGARYPGAAAAGALVRAAFGVARALAPTIVHIDAPELLFGEGKAPSTEAAGAGAGAAGRLLYSRWRAPIEREVAALSASDRVVVVGCSARPLPGTAEFVGMWDRAVRLAPPGYGSRRAAWESLLLRTARAVAVAAGAAAAGGADDGQEEENKDDGPADSAERRRRRRLLRRACALLEAQLRVQPPASGLASASAAPQPQPQPPLDAGGLSTLALLSEGLTPGSIEGVCRAVLTSRRLSRMVPEELGGGGGGGGGGGLVGASASAAAAATGPLRLAELLEWLPAAASAAAASDSAAAPADYDAFEAAVLARGCGPVVGGLFASASGGAEDGGGCGGGK